MFSNLLWSCLLVTVLANQNAQAKRQKPIYEQILNESDYSIFYKLMKSNSVAIRNLKFSPLTVFIPENEAFDLYDYELLADVASYHMTFEVKTIRMLKSTSVLSSVRLENPPLWITKVDEDVYVNNAKIVQSKSNYVARSFEGSSGQLQVLHTIDRVLDPMIKFPKHPPKASNFLSSVDKWDLGGTKSVTKFHHRVLDNRSLQLFEEDTPKTFFVPIDSGIDANKYRRIDEKVIQRHIVPNHVLFTRPSERNVVSVAKSDFPFTITIEKRQDSWFVISDEDDFEQFSAEILVPDIPLRNGVLHLISQPLGNFFKILRPFPFLPIIEKVSGDPEIDVFYKMGSLTKFNQKLKKENVNYTYFVPKDTAWLETKKMGLEPVDLPYDILAKHLVISEMPYSMQQLVSMSRANGYKDIELTSDGGPLRMTVDKNDGGYFIKWNRRYIKVERPDYECTNGIIHIISGPMVHFRRHDDNTDMHKNTEINVKSLVSYWDIVQNMTSKDI